MLIQIEITGCKDCPFCKQEKIIEQGCSMQFLYCSHKNIQHHSIYERIVEPDKINFPDFCPFV